MGYAIEFIENWNNSFGDDETLIDPGVVNNWYNKYYENFANITEVPDFYNLQEGNIDIQSGKLTLTNYNISENTNVITEEGFISKTTDSIKLEVDVTIDWDLQGNDWAGYIKLYAKKADGNWQEETKHLYTSGKKEILLEGDFSSYKIEFYLYNPSYVVGEHLQFDNIRIDYNITEDIGDLKLIDVELDPIKFVGESFFLREPRRLNLTLQDNDAGFLVKNFIYNTGNYTDNLNVIIYYDENGEVIDDLTNESGYAIGDSYDNVKIDDKETIVQQLSKIVVRLVDNDTGEKYFVGLIDKASCSYDLDYVEIEVVGFLWIFKQLAEQLVRVMDNESLISELIVSPDIIFELFKKIEELTKINLKSEPNININDFSSIYDSFNDVFSHDNIPTGSDIVNIIQLLNLEDLYNDDFSVESIPEGTDYNDDIIYYHSLFNYFGSEFQYDGALKTVDSKLRTFIGYNNNNPYVFIGLPCYKTKLIFWAKDGEAVIGIKAYVVYKTYDIKDDSFSSGTESFSIDGFEMTYSSNDWATASQDFLDNGYCRQKYEEAWQKFVENHKGSKTCFFSEEIQGYGGNKFAFVNDYFFGWTKQLYYSVAIPVYTETYSYLELLKTILFINNITIYTAPDGTITFAKRDFENISSNYIDSNVVIKPYNVGTSQKEDIDLTPLDKIFVDDNYVGPNGELLDTYIKSKYQLIFNKIPSEISFKLDKDELDDVDIEITPGTAIKFYIENIEHIVVITQYSLDKDKLFYDIKGYLYENNS